MGGTAPPRHSFASGETAGLAVGVTVGNAAIRTLRVQVREQPTDVSARHWLGMSWYRLALTRTHTTEHPTRRQVKRARAWLHQARDDLLAGQRGGYLARPAIAATLRDIARLERRLERQ